MGESSGARRTEAVKLSVKLLSGLTLVALIAVAVVGLSRSASAAADAQIYITNKASNLTTESPAPSGRTTATTVYGTYKDAAERDIVTNSDRFIVTVVDPDLNLSPDVIANDSSDLAGPPAIVGEGFEILGTGVGRSISSDVIAVTNPGNDALDDVGDQFRIILDEFDEPVVGSASDVKICQGAATSRATCVEVSGLSVSGIFAAGNGTSTYGIVNVNVTGAVSGLTTSSGAANDAGLISVLYKTSAVETTTATVKSVVHPDGESITLTETGRDTGRYEGEIWVKELGTGADQITVAGAVPGTVVQIPAVDGAITVTYNDQNTAGTAQNVKRHVSATLDTTSPTVTFSAPTTGSETQTRKPTFAGTVTDSNSGIDANSFTLWIDQRDNPNNDNVIATVTGAANTGMVIMPDGTNNGTNANVVLSAVNGANSASFSHVPGSNIPTANTVGNLPNHIVDFQAQITDIAGNIGWSDADTSTTVGYLGNKPHTVKIDQQIPVIASSVTGKGYNSVDPTTDLTNVRDTVKVIFDGNVKASSVSASDFKVTLSGSGAVFVPASIVVNGANVYLDIDSTIPSDNTPSVSIQGTIQDLAGNSTDAGSSSATDGISPVLTVTRSGGTGLGTGSEGPDSLTTGNMTITVTSDEDLTSAPTIKVQRLVTGAALQTATAIPQGGNVWKLVVAAGGPGGHAVKVDASDGTNTASFGDLTTKVYQVDTGIVAAPNQTFGTTLTNPFITASYSGDDSSLTVTKATMDGVDVTSSVVASADKKIFFFQPTTALTNGEHKFIIKVKDAAGNEREDTFTVTKSSRTDFVIELFAGWNAISVPSNPIDNSIGSVFSNAGVKQVVAYDATSPAQPWRIASKVDGSFSSQTEPALTSINPGHGYWVETSDFENQKVALEGPTGPGDARPSLITIPTGNGWNLVGVVDQSRIQTQASSRGATLQRPDSTGADQSVDAEAYFNTVNAGRAYTFDTVDSEFRNVILKSVTGGVTSDNMKIGSGVWVFISPQENGKLPHIVP